MATWEIIIILARLVACALVLGIGIFMLGVIIVALIALLVGAIDYFRKGGKK